MSRVGYSLGEERVLGCLPCWNSVWWNPHETFLDQICSQFYLFNVIGSFIVGSEQLNNINGSQIDVAFKKLDDGSLTNVGKRLHFLLRWHTKNLCLLQNLKTFLLTREQWCSRYQLKQNTARGPHINAEVVIVRAKDKFWASIVAWNHIRRIHSFFWKVEHFGCSEVCNFNHQT